jgi:transposase-like protein
MRAEQKLMILEEVERSVVPKQVVLSHMGIPSSTYYRWRAVYERDGVSGLEDRSPQAVRVWNRLTQEEHDTVVEQALVNPEEPPRR